MKNKTKELIRDISFMVWGFVGAGVCFNLMIFRGLGYLNKDILKIISMILEKYFIIIGFSFIGFLILILGLRRLNKFYKTKWKKHAQGKNQI